MIEEDFQFTTIAPSRFHKSKSSGGWGQVGAESDFCSNEVPQEIAFKNAIFTGGTEFRTHLNTIQEPDDEVDEDTFLESYTDDDDDDYELSYQEFKRMNKKSKFDEALAMLSKELSQCATHLSAGFKAVAEQTKALSEGCRKSMDESFKNCGYGLIKDIIIQPVLVPTVHEQVSIVPGSSDYYQSGFTGSPVRSSASRVTFADDGTRLDPSPPRRDDTSVYTSNSHLTNFTRRREPRSRPLALPVGMRDMLEEIDGRTVIITHTPTWEKRLPKPFMDELFRADVELFE